MRGKLASSNYFNHPSYKYETHDLLLICVNKLLTCSPKTILGSIFILFFTLHKSFDRYLVKIWKTTHFIWLKCFKKVSFGKNVKIDKSSILHFVLTERIFWFLICSDFEQKVCTVQEFGPFPNSALSKNHIKWNRVNWEPNVLWPVCVWYSFCTTLFQVIWPLFFKSNYKVAHLVSL